MEEGGDVVQMDTMEDVGVEVLNSESRGVHLGNQEGAFPWEGEFVVGGKVADEN